MSNKRWEVELSEQVNNWLSSDALTRDELTAVTSAITYLSIEGPSLGRPLVDTIRGSQHNNMKELRPLGTHIRILFMFDEFRVAVLLVGGSKKGEWNRWYTKIFQLLNKFIRSGEMKFTKFDDWYDEAIKSGRIKEEEVERGVEKARAATQGFRLRSLRKQLRLTQQQLADRINVSQSRISAIENGDIERMRVDVIVKYISALGGELQLHFALPNGQEYQERYPDPESEHAFIGEKAFRVEQSQDSKPTGARFNPRTNSLRNDAVGNTNIRIRNRAA